MPQLPMVSQVPVSQVPETAASARDAPGTERWHDVVDPVWARLRNEAEEATEREPLLAGFFTSAILGQPQPRSRDRRAHRRPPRRHRPAGLRHPRRLA